MVSLLRCCIILAGAANTLASSAGGRWKQRRRLRRLSGNIWDNVALRSKNKPQTDGECADRSMPLRAVQRDEDCQPSI
jgi:hypothetical protein